MRPHDRSIQTTQAIREEYGMLNDGRSRRGIVPDQTLEPPMVNALSGIYLGLESLQRSCCMLSKTM
jgi:hypothetical protein